VSAPPVTPHQSVAIVTGATGGIGLAIVDALLAAGHSVAAGGRDLEPLAGRVNQTKNRLFPSQVDVGDSAQVQLAIDRAERLPGGVSIVVNNAGVLGSPGRDEESARDQWDRVLRINLTAVFEICRRTAPLMAARGYGRVVNVSSVSGLRGQAEAAAYGASKAGVIGLTRSLAKDYARRGVTFNCVAPGLIQTRMVRELSPDAAAQALARIPMGRSGLPEEVAAMVAWMVSPASSFTTGAIFDVSGGRLAW
jgi:3-oxoacyl-[acyl-carrier protein] reductase